MVCRTCLGRRAGLRNPALQWGVPDTPITPDEQPIFDALLEADVEPKAAYTAVQRIRELAARNIAALIEAQNAQIVGLIEAQNAKIEAQNAKIDAQGARFDTQIAKIESKFDAQNARFEAQNAKIESKIEAQNARFDAQNATFESKFDAQRQQFIVLRWMIGGVIVLLGLVAAQAFRAPVQIQSIPAPAVASAPEATAPVAAAPETPDPAPAR